MSFPVLAAVFTPIMPSVRRFVQVRLILDDFARFVTIAHRFCRVAHEFWGEFSLLTHGETNNKSYSSKKQII